MRRSGTEVLCGLLVVALGVLALWAAPAQAAAPANDDFADRQALVGSLPIIESDTNVEATRETGEPFLPFGAGHTVWYEWKATTTGFVTVGTCGTTFDTEIGVYIGTELNALGRVADTSNGGPGCPSTGRQATFKAIADATYEIAVDGNGFYLPAGPKPVTEGTIALQIEATPAPANDSFESAVELLGREEEEPQEPPFYFASTLGYNWGAGKQVGEPEHAGDPGGASVWFTWTAPATGSARLSVQGNWFDSLLAIYAGSALGALTPLPSSAPFGLQVPVTAGTTYRIAVDGKRDSGNGEASVGSFSMLLFMQLPLRERPPAPAALSPPPGDKTPPETTLTRSVLKRRPAVISFHFKSSEPGSVFRCRLDRQPFRACVAPKGFGQAAPGRHMFRVKAVDMAGNEDPTPAVAHFRIPRQPHRHHR